MKFGIVYFPWTTGAASLQYVLEDIMEQETVRLWHKEDNKQVFEQLDGVFVPDGFCEPEILHSSKLAVSSPIVKHLTEYAHKGGLVIGLNNGFQILCELGLLPGHLTQNESGKFICRNTHVIAVHSHSRLTSLVDTDHSLIMPLAQKRGCYAVDENLLQPMYANAQVLFVYCTENGDINNEANPNGSDDNIAAICNDTHNVYGLMFHPDRAADDELGNTDGKAIFDSIIHPLFV